MWNATIYSFCCSIQTIHSHRSVPSWGSSWPSAEEVQQHWSFAKITIKIPNGKHQVVFVRVSARHLLAKANLMHLQVKHGVPWISTMCQLSSCNTKTWYSYLSTYGDNQSILANTIGLSQLSRRSHKALLAIFFKKVVRLIFGGHPTSIRPRT